MKEFVIYLALIFLLPVGVISLQYQSRIYNGVPAKMENTKHQASIRDKLREDFHFGGGHFCGGVLISRNVILTAAHCLTLDDPSYYSVVMGSLMKNVKDNNTLVFNATEILPHPRFDEKTISNDIGLIFLAQDVPAGHPNVEQIELANYSIPDGTTCQVSGWGITELETTSDELLTIDVPIVSISKCNESYNGILMQRGQICAGNNTDGKDACEGDSGGPMVCEGLLAGIVSAGSDCGLMHKSGIYTDVNYFRPWIQGEMAKRNLAHMNFPSLVVVGMMSFVVLSKLFFATK